MQEEICREMEALKAEANLEVAGRRMRELQARWKQVALAPRAQGEAMWRRFKTAQDEVYARTSAFFAAQNEERTGNLLRKQALCDRAEALAGSTDWVKTASEIQGLQAEWKTIGPVARGHEKAIWERFRRACDQFFTRRQEDLKHRKEEWAANLARKEALCVAAEELAESTDWDQSAAKLKQLQAEWKKIGPVRKSKSEAIWQRFRAACDRFFDRFKHRDQVELAGEGGRSRDGDSRTGGAHPAGVCRAAAGPGKSVRRPSSGARDQVAAGAGIAARRSTGSCRAISSGRRANRCRRGPGRLPATDLDPEATRKRMEKLLAKVEELAAAQASRPVNLSPTELLAQQLRERLAANTMSGGARAAEAEDARWRASEQEVRSAQAQWMRLGPVPPQVAGPLNERFQRACRRFFDQRRRASSQLPTPKFQLPSPNDSTWSSELTSIAQSRSHHWRCYESSVGISHRSLCPGALLPGAAGDGPTLQPLWTLTSDFASPESAYYDAGSNAVFVSSINGQILEKDGNGYISRLSPDGKMVSAKWVTGLNAPKGIRSLGGTLWVTDIDEVVSIDIATARITARVKVEGAQFLNDLATAPDGTVYASDSNLARIYAVKDGKSSVVRGRRRSG